MQLGLVTLGDCLPDPVSGAPALEAERFRQLVELGVLAGGLGYDTFHVGEHHFSDYALSSPTPVLAAVAERTSTVRLSTAVSLLGHHDPVRIAEDYATVDVLSGGRVELIGGRGVYVQHYRQFGQRPEDAEALLVEAVQLLRRLWTEEQVSWAGTIRPPLTDVTVRPRPLQLPHPPIWLSASSPASVERAVAAGCPIVIPTVSTGVDLPPALARQYRAAWASAGRDPAEAKVGLHVHCYVGSGDAEAARREWQPYQAAYLAWVLRDVRGYEGPLPEPFATLDRADSQAVCGDAPTVAAELARRVESMGGVDRLLVQCDQGGLPWDLVAGSVNRIATEVRRRLG